MVSDQRGSAAVETVLLVPVMLLFVALMVAGARLHLARAEVTDAASTGARAASLQYSAGAAERAARAQVHRELHSTCDPMTEVNTAGFARPVGTPAEVRVRVRCDVFFDDVILPGMPGRITVESEFGSVLDTYRRRR